MKYKAKAGSVTLTGTVDSQAKRTEAATLASQVPNVKEVINELQIRNQESDWRTRAVSLGCHRGGRQGA